LQQISRERTNPGLEAATFLARQGDLSVEQAHELVQLLESHPASKTFHRLLALDLQVRTEPGRKEQFIEAGFKKYLAGSTEDLAMFCTWLNEKREFATTLRAAPLDRALADRNLLMLRLDALGGLNRWKEVQDVLRKPQLPLPEAYLEAFRARTATKLNDPAGAAASWRKSLQAASGSADELAFLAQYAEKNGEYEQAKRAYRALVAAQSNPLAVYLSWSRMTQQHGTTEELRDLLKEMAERWPDEVSFKNDLAYVELLLNRNIESSLRFAAALVDSFPLNLPFRATLALGRLRSNNPAAALDAFRGRDWDWDRALPGNRAIYAAALAAAGKTGDARIQARSLPAEALRPEERELIKGLLIWK